MRRNEVLPVVKPIGEWQMGPGPYIEFESRPVALPRTTVDVEWGAIILRVRVAEREGLKSYGRILSTRRNHRIKEPVAHPQVEALDLVVAGLRAMTSRL